MPSWRHAVRSCFSSFQGPAFVPSPCLPGPAIPPHPTRTSTLRHATDHKSTPIIFVPEIKGSKLADVYPTDFDGRWRPEDFVVGTIFEDPLDCDLVEIFW